ncbi:MAG: hypothetical protein ACR2NP_12090 [Pirellulaceae bacterium]
MCKLFPITFFIWAMQGSFYSQRRYVMLMFVLALSVPLTGAWYFAREHQIKSRVHRVDAALLQDQQLSRVRQFAIHGFTIRGEEPVKVGSYEYMRIEASPSELLETTSLPHSRTLLLRRRTGFAGSLRDCVAEGVVEGRYSPQFELQRGVAERLEEYLPGFDSANCLVLDVDCDYRSQIAWVSVGMTVYAMVLFVVGLAWVHRRCQRIMRRQERTKCEVGLEVALARHDHLRVVP